MSNRLIVFPAGASYIGNLEAGRRSGFEIVTIDRDPEAPGFDIADYAEPVDITDAEGAIRIARKYDVSGAIPMNDYAVPTAARIADDLDLIGIYPDVADACTDKASMRKRWAADGLPQPAFRVAEVLEEAWDAAADIGYPVVLKPAVSTGGGSRGVSLVDGPTDLETAFEFAQSAYEDDRVLVEERANGTEHSVEVVVQKGDASALVVSDKVKTPAPYRVDKSVMYPTSLDDSMRERVE